MNIFTAKQSGRLGIIIGFEGGKVLEGSVGVLSCLYRLGVRHIQLCWACENQLVAKDAEKGLSLTGFGKEVIREMNKIGMLCDISHLPERAFWEVLEISEKPVIDSHCSVQAYSPDEGLSDEEIKALAERGGLMGLHFCSHYVRKGKNPASIDDVIDEIDYIAGLAGIDYVGLGPDYFLYDANFKHNTNQFNLSWVKALESPDKMMNFTAAMITRGYSEEQITKVLGGNFLRVAADVFQE
ncbi:MAG: membrane dipeptidase [Spirochaetota bacterium]